MITLFLQLGWLASSPLTRILLLLEVVLHLDFDHIREHHLIGIIIDNIMVTYNLLFYLDYNILTTHPMNSSHPSPRGCPARTQRTGS